MAEPPLIPYGALDTQFGVITERLPDGGIRLTVPAQHLLTKVAANTINAVLPLITDRRLQPARLIVTLNAHTLHVYDPTRQPNIQGQHTYSWAIETIGVIRSNRFERGVYVTITGHDSFDLIPDCDERLVHYVGDTLEQTLAELRSRGQ